MSVLQWSDDFCTGLDAVDQQHRRLVDMLNKLNDTRSGNGDTRTVLSLLDELASLTLSHCAYEERMIHSPRLERQQMARLRAEHLAFIEKLADVQLEVQRDPRSLDDDKMDFLAALISEHILGDEREMVAPFQSRNETASTLNTVNDSDALVAALHKSDARFHELADRVPALIWLSDADGRRTWFNRQWREFTGLDTERLQQNDWLQCIHPEDAQFVLDSHDDAHQDRADRMVEFRLRRADRRYRWFRETRVARQDPDGSFAGEVGCALDITERRQAQRLLHGARQRLEAMVQERTEQLTRANLDLTRQLQQTHDRQPEPLGDLGQLASGGAREVDSPIDQVCSNLSELKERTDDLLHLLDTLTGLESELPTGDRRHGELKALRQDLPRLLNESLQGAKRARQIAHKLRDSTNDDRQDPDTGDLDQRAG